MDLNLEKFSPQKAELQTLANKYKTLEIDGVDDVSGYEIVNTARKDLAKKRSNITNTGKDLRREALDFQKAVIIVEKELIEIIQPIELELKAKQEAIDEEKKRFIRLAALPSRRTKVAEIPGLEVSDDELMGMESEEFTEWFEGKKAEYLAEEERKLEEERQRVAREKEIAEAKKQAKEEAERAAEEEAKRKAAEVKEREKKLKEEAEEAQKRAVEKAKRKAEKEKQDLIEEQKRKDQEREAEAIRAQKEEEALEEAKAKESARIEKLQKYQKFLTDNGYTKTTKSEFHLEKTETEITLYKKIGTFII